MTLIDLVKLGLLDSDQKAEEFAADLIDRWHDGLIPGQLRDVLGLTPREYQAWTTGEVSLLTIAQWHQTCHPPLDTSKPWFKISGKPGQETVGYLDDKLGQKHGSTRRRKPVRKK